MKLNACSVSSRDFDVLTLYLHFCILIFVEFEWDLRKNERNREKHGISFEEAQEIFGDPFHLSVIDLRFSYFEERWITIGRTGRRRIVVAVHMYLNSDGDEVIRMISAREATAHERKRYEQHA